MGDPVEEILNLLGLGDQAQSQAQGDALDSLETPLAEAASYRLLKVVNDTGAEWIELEGIDPVFRVTRTKAKLLRDLGDIVAAWSRGVPPPSSHGASQIRLIGNDKSRLEIRHKDWRPIRMTKLHANAITRFRIAIGEFADGN
ncbi:hypothetical protein V7S57_23445 [Caulobacter sp. CCNWLY153]|uniref:hypothetical protein n=1 Tax=unclassified Caulobacter TaxID=2648921 RepID=UPI002FF2CF0C